MLRRAFTGSCRPFLKIETNMLIDKYAKKGPINQALINAAKIVNASVPIIKIGGASCRIFMDLGCLRMTFLFQQPY